MKPIDRKKTEKNIMKVRPIHCYQYSYSTPFVRPKTLLSLFNLYLCFLYSHIFLSFSSSCRLHIVWTTTSDSQSWKKYYFYFFFTILLFHYFQVFPTTSTSTLLFDFGASLLLLLLLFGNQKLATFPALAGAGQGIFF